MYKNKDPPVKDTFAKEQKLLKSCQAPFSFYQLVEDLWHPKSNSGSDPMSRLCTLMRKMKVKSFIKEELELNEELLEEQGQVLFLVEIIEACGFNQQPLRLGSLYRVSSPS